MLFKDEFTLLEKPASRDERLIADLMKQYFEALKTHDLKLLLSLFSKNAHIDLRIAGGVISLEQYTDTMRRILPLTSEVYLRDLFIHIQNSKTATVNGFSHYVYRGTRERWSGRMWKLEKEDDRWVITGSHYYPI